MKKLFSAPVVEVKSLSPDTEVMGVFSLASSLGKPADTLVIKEDTTSVSTGDNFSYWTSK